MLWSARHKIESEKSDDSLKVCCEAVHLDRLLIIGGGHPNTYGAVSVEYFKANGS